MRVAVGRQHLEDAVLDAQDRDVEGAAAEVVHGDEPGVPLVEAIGERRGGRLVDDAEDVEPGDPPGVARGGPLRVVEIRGHRDDRAIDLGVDLALLGEERLGAMLQLAQDERRDLRRRELARAEPDLDDSARIAGETEREQPRLVADVVDALAHEALHGVDRAAGIGQQTTLGLAPDVYRLILGDRHDRRQQRVAAAIADHDRHAVLHVGDEAVGGAEIDADDFAHNQKCFTEAGHNGRARIYFFLCPVSSWSSRVQLPLDPLEQVVDVVPLEHAFAQRAQDRFPL